MSTKPPRKAEHDGSYSSTGAGSYYSNCRWDLLALIDFPCKSVLSVGCGEGATEAELVKRGCSVVAVEANAEVAAVAQRKGIEVICADVETCTTALEGRGFDLLLYADVLEHTTDPEAVLSRHVGLLGAGGRVIVSVPNFQRLDAIWALVVGDWPSRDAGIFDRTHCQVTTEKVVRRWFEACSITPIRIVYKLSGQRRYRWLAAAAAGFLDRYFALHVIMVGQKRGSAGTS